jgi:hypothetical protein
MDRNDAKQLAAGMNGALVAVDALGLLLLSFAASQQAYATTGNIDMEQPWLPLAFCFTPRAAQRATYHQACSTDAGKLFGRCIGCPAEL